MIDIFGINPDISTVLSDMLFLFVPAQRFSHIECVFSLFRCCGVVTVIVDDSSENTIPAGANQMSHLFISFTIYDEACLTLAPHKDL